MAINGSRRLERQLPKTLWIMNLKSQKKKGKHWRWVNFV